MPRGEVRQRIEPIPALFFCFFCIQIALLSPNLHGATLSQLNKMDVACKFGLTKPVTARQVCAGDDLEQVARKLYKYHVQGSPLKYLSD